jgi:hypothetical protein
VKPNTHITYLLPVLVFLLIHGCASAPKFLSNEDRSKTRSIVLAIESEDDQMNVIDVTQIRKQEYSRTYGGIMHGAIGGAMETLIIEGISTHKIGSLIGGSIGPVRESISGYDTKTVFDRLVLKGITENMVDLNRLHNLPVHDVRASNRIGEPRSTDADVLLKIKYRYGIGAYNKQKPFPAMIAQISVESLSENKMLMKNIWMASGCENRSYTLDDYAKNGGEIYKRCFEEMVEQFGRNLVNVFF